MFVLILSPQQLSGDCRHGLNRRHIAPFNDSENVFGHFVHRNRPGAHIIERQISKDIFERNKKEIDTSIGYRAKITY